MSTNTVYIYDNIIMLFTLFTVIIIIIIILFKCHNIPRVKCGASTTFTSTAGTRTDADRLSDKGKKSLKEHHRNPQTRRNAPCLDKGNTAIGNAPHTCQKNTTSSKVASVWFLKHILIYPLDLCLKLLPSSGTFMLTKCPVICKLYVR